MQGNWTVRVKSKSAAFDQRFVISGAGTGNGTHAGTVGTTVAVTGTQWSIAIQNNPGTDFQLSDTRIKLPQQVTNGYNTGLSGQDYSSASIYMECLGP